MDFLSLYSIFDKVSEEFSAPVALKNTGVAKRWFNQNLSSVPEDIKNDFELWLVGKFDPVKGVISPCSINCSKLDVEDDGTLNLFSEMKKSMEDDLNA